jgi:hypothetical protein
MDGKKGDPTPPLARVAFRMSLRKATIALCVAGELRTFFEPGVQTRLRAAVLEPFAPEVYFQVSLQDHSPGSQLVVHKATHEMAIEELHTYKPIALNVKSDAELEAHPLWRGQLIHQSHLAFRWSLCMDDMETREEQLGLRYDWVVRLRPDMLWFCSLPQRPPPIGVVFIWDMVAIMDRAHANFVMRQYPLGFGFVPCFYGYPEHCTWSLALLTRSSDSEVRFVTPWAQVVYFRRNCRSILNGTCEKEDTLDKPHLPLPLCTLEQSLTLRPENVSILDALIRAEPLVRDLQNHLQFLA